MQKFDSEKRVTKLLNSEREIQHDVLNKIAPYYCDILYLLFNKQWWYENMSEELRVLVPFEVILVNKNVFKSMIFGKIDFLGVSVSQENWKTI